MNPHDLLTRADLVEFEKRLISKLSDLITEVSFQDSQVQEDLLTKRQMMQVLNVSENTFDKLASEGLPSIKVGDRNRYEKNEVINYLKVKNKSFLTLKV